MTVEALPAPPIARPRRTFGDRLNPILVKEVRQSLRGRFFGLMFWLTLVIATLSGLLIVASAATDDQIEVIGTPFFMAIFGCLAAAVHAFTPFSAFLSTSAEWDESTHDLLVLSDLKPRQIVLGKLFSALVQALLYYSTFGPFLVFAYLLNGVDLLAIGVILVGSFATCVALSLVGIALASAARVKAVRGLLMALFGTGLAVAWGISMGMATSIVGSPQTLRDAEFQAGVVFYVMMAGLVGGLFGAVAAGRLAHEEENRSTGMRLLSLAIVLLAAIWGAWMNATFHFSWLPAVAQQVAALLLFLLWVFFLTEREALGRRTAKYVTPRRWLALLSMPFLPGGGLGVLLFLTHGLVALLGTSIGLALGGSLSASDVPRSLAMILVTYAYAFVFVALPAGAASYVVKSARGRAVVRLVIALLLPLAIFLPAVLGLMLGIRPWMELEHALNPFWVILKVGAHGRPHDVSAALVLLFVAVLITLVVNAPRVFGGVRAVAGASRARRAARG